MPRHNAFRGPTCEIVSFLRRGGLVNPSGPMVPALCAAGIVPPGDGSAAPASRACPPQPAVQLPGRAGPAGRPPVGPGRHSQPHIWDVRCAGRPSPVRTPIPRMMQGGVPGPNPCQMAWTFHESFTRPQFEFCFRGATVLGEMIFPNKGAFFFLQNVILFF